MSQINISVGRSTGETAEDAGHEILLQLSTDSAPIAAAALRAVADSLDPRRPILREQLERHRDGKR